MTQSYDPSFFVEKELFIEQLREEAQGSPEKHQEFIYELTEAYSYALGLYRQFVTAYNDKSRDDAWKQFKQTVRTLVEVLDSE